MNHIGSQSNIADILSKHWSHKSAYPLLRPVFHYVGDTGDLFIDDMDTTVDGIDTTANQAIAGNTDMITNTDTTQFYPWGVTNCSGEQRLARLLVSGDLVGSAAESPNSGSAVILYSRQPTDFPFAAAAATGHPLLPAKLILPVK